MGRMRGVYPVCFLRGTVQVHKCKDAQHYQDRLKPEGFCNNVIEHRGAYRLRK